MQQTPCVHGPSLQHRDSVDDMSLAHHDASTPLLVASAFKGVDAAHQQHGSVVFHRVCGDGFLPSTPVCSQNTCHVMSCHACACSLLPLPFEKYPGVPDPTYKPPFVVGSMPVTDSIRNDPDIVLVAAPGMENEIHMMVGGMIHPNLSSNSMLMHEA